MSLVVGTNSYITLGEANTYLSDRYDNSVWMSEQYRSSAIVTAARLLDSQLKWLYCKTDSDQDMEWPRTGFAGVDDDVVPQKVKDAQAELAFDIVKNGALPEGFKDTSLKSLKAGSVELVYKNGSMKTSSMIPKHIRNMVVAYTSSGYRVQRA